MSDGDDYSPIQQSYELRKIRSEICKLRGENQRLKERLQAARLTADEDDDLSREQGSSKAAAKAIASRLRHFKTGDRTDNLYFGTPGLANIVSNVSMEIASLSDSAERCPVCRSGRWNPVTNTHHAHAEACT